MLATTDLHTLHPKVHNVQTKTTYWQHTPYCTYLLTDEGHARDLLRRDPAADVREVTTTTISTERRVSA